MNYPDIKKTTNEVFLRQLADALATRGRKTPFPTCVQIAGRLRKVADEVERTRNAHAVLRDAIDRGGLDLSPCQNCGLLVACIPDGMPMCEACGEDPDAGS